MRELRGKVAVVTGGASGIGRAMADRFAREGMKIVLADVEADPLAKAYEEMKGSGVEVLAVRTDVSKWEDVEALARRTFEAFGTAHIVCNNAGIAASGGAAWQATRGHWEWAIGVNLWGVIHGIRAFVPRLIEQGEGHVVNTASIAGLITLPTMASYCVTKGAVVALSECLHHDLETSAGGKVKVSVLCPAWVKTRINESHRNQPASAAPAPVKEALPGQVVSMTAASTAVTRGIPPEIVADKVLSAIVEERFWIITHSKTKRLIESRMRGILDGTNPTFDPIAG